jgi:hypothetical protein
MRRVRPEGAKFYCGNNLNQNSIIMPDSGLGDYSSPEDIGMKDGILALLKHGNYLGPKKLQNRVHAVYAPSHELSNAHR